MPRLRVKTDINEGIDPVITNVNGKIDCVLLMKMHQSAVFSKCMLCLLIEFVSTLNI